MLIEEKIVEYVFEVLFKPVVTPLTEKLEAWLASKGTRKALLEAARAAEIDFRALAKKKFGNDELTQAVASFPLYNGELFQAALQSLPSHLDETFLEHHLSRDLTKYWPGEFTSEEIRAATALYLDCLRVRLLRVKGFAENITQLATLRTDRRTEVILEGMNELLDKFPGESKEADKIAFRSLHQLPQPPADFTGREELITQLIDDFRSHKGAAITGKSLHGLIGMGGVGKTALGLVVAHKLSEEYPDAQIFLDLKGTTEPLNATDIMRHVILSFEPAMDLRALDEKGIADAYYSVLHNKKALLFLDNARSADQIKPLIPPDTCALLVTSRWTFPVTGLKNHALDVMGVEDAQTFILELCPRIGEHADALAKACGYLPLALRIAGSFLQVNVDWSVIDYLKQLNDRKGRLATLRESHQEAELKAEPDLLAAFELSYNQLEEEDQKRWRVLGVFPTSFGISAAQAMWEMEENETRKSLSLFCRYSLLDYDETTGRYSLHDLLADYACAQMEQREEVIARIAHADHYSNVLGAISQMYLQGGEDILPALRLYDIEWTNIEAGQKTSVLYMEQNKKATKACSLYAGQGPINRLRLLPKDNLKWLEDGLQASKLLENKTAEASHLGNLGNAYADLGNLNKAIEFHEQALVVDREIGDRRGEGQDLNNMGLAYADLGDYRKAIEFYEQALVIAREIGDRRGEGNALNNLGIAYYSLGDARKAIEFYEQTLVITREIGDRRGEGNALNNLGLACYSLGDARKAIEFYEQTLVITREIGDRGGEGQTLGNLGLAYYSLGDARKAIEYYEQSLVIAREIGDRRGEGGVLGNLGVAYKNLGEVNKAIEFYEQHLLITREIGDRRGEGQTLGNLGIAYKNLGEVNKAIETYEQSLLIKREIDDRRGEGDTLYNMGLALNDLDEKDRAIDLVKQALVIYEAIESPYAERARNTLKKWGALPADPST